MPLWHDRVEAAVGFGGAYSLFKPKISRQSWLIYGEGGVNYAFDSTNRYRTGIMVRWHRDPIGEPVQQWVSVGGQISYAWHY